MQQLPRYIGDEYIEQIVWKNFRENQEEQSGFRVRRLCTDNIFWLKQIIQKRNTFDDTGTDTNEIERQIVQAKKVIGCLNSIFWMKDIKKNT